MRVCHSALMTTRSRVAALEGRASSSREQVAQQVGCKLGLRAPAISQQAFTLHSRVDYLFPTHTDEGRSKDQVRVCGAPAHPAGLRGATPPIRGAIGDDDVTADSAPEPAEVRNRAKWRRASYGCGECCARSA